MDHEHAVVCDAVKGYGVKMSVLKEKHCALWVWCGQWNARQRSELNRHMVGLLIMSNQESCTNIYYP